MKKEALLENISFDFNDKEYTFGYTMDGVYSFANLSMAKKGQITEADIIKGALSSLSSTKFITDNTIENMYPSLIEGFIKEDGDKLTYKELISYILMLFIQTIDEKSKEVSPAIIELNANGTAKVTVDEKEYELKFTRSTIKDEINAESLSLSNMFEIFAVGSNIVKAALSHDKKHRSNKVNNEIFLSIWATKFNEDTENDLTELVEGLLYHMKEVVDSGVKKSGAAIKMK